ncbi:ankyrin repeat domain-containing protein [Aspergillus ibericus CBS 121593]|uniref:Ankyrin n=1 Tax=Aspergillus ibericus CBS 121593 TaxID=1448316 RepID=A0A395H1Y3_9EURO|nr:ankyrin [Aspergillus ibericus CBS 121593]RAL00858.1 ankyrin [Aspergillus ibericus CBS 121593]
MNNQIFPLSALPEELVLYIIKELDNQSLSLLGLTCKWLYRICRVELLHIAKRIGRPEQRFFDKLDVRIMEDHDVRSGMTEEDYADELWNPENFAEEPFSGAVERGAYDSVKFFLEAGLSANTFNLHRITMLHAAVGAGHVDIVRLLLENGADVTLTIRGGLTPLDKVCDAPASTQRELARLLLEAGSKVKFMESLLLAIFRTEGHALLLQMLIEKNDLNLHTWRNRDSGFTALHLAAEIDGANEAGDKASAVKCVLHHAPELLNEFGSQYPWDEPQTALIGAIRSGSQANGVCLIERGITLAVNHDRNTPRYDALEQLNQAAFRRKPDVIRALLARPEMTAYGSLDWNPEIESEIIASMLGQLFKGDGTLIRQSVEVMKLLVEGRHFPHDARLINSCGSITKDKRRKTDRENCEVMLELLEKAMPSEHPQ